MIVVDSSALIAVLFNELEKPFFQDVIIGGESCVMSAVNVHETACVLRVRHGPQAVARLWQLLTDSEIEIVPFDEAQVRAAAIAFDRFGKGIHSKARLNLADCAAYALAATMNAPWSIQCAVALLFHARFAHGIASRLCRTPSPPRGARRSGGVPHSLQHTHRQSI